MKIARFNAEDKSVQSVEEHLKNVKRHCEAVAAKIGFAYVAILVGILHDMGKLGDSFQKYIKSQMEDGGQSHNSKVDHAVFGAKYIYEKYKDDKGIKSITSEIIALVVCYHHGGLPDCVDNNNKSALIERINRLDENEFKEVVLEFEAMFGNEILELFQKACEEISAFFDSLKMFKNMTLDAFLFYPHLLVKTIYSILIDSDWFDSSMSMQKDDEFLNDENLSSYIKNLEDKLSKFKENQPKSEMQKTVFDKRNEISQDVFDFAKNKTGVYTLTVPTGGGKTLASFRFALNHAKTNKKSRIFYIAPYTSIIEQNASEIKNTLKCGENLLEYHSNVVSKDEEAQTSEKEYNEIDRLSERWDYHFVFTTMVQFLNTFFAAPNFNIRRLQSFFNSVIIFDEVQTLPIECVTLFNYTVNFLSKFLNCSILLCTATQPVLNKLKKPIILSENNEIVKDVQDAFEKLERVKIIDKTKIGRYKAEDVLELISEVKAQDSSLLVILNTVKAAEKIFNLLKEKPMSNKTFYLSSQLCPMHRQNVVSEIKQALNNNEDIICISTQVMECGVDLSFDTVIRSLAGLDSIAQAAGRCNRHGEKDKGYTYIINLDTDIEKTDRIKTIEIGKKNSKAMLELFKEKPEKYQNSLLSTSVISEYFRKYFNEENIDKVLDYPLDKKGGSIYDLLSSNQEKRSNYNDYSKDSIKMNISYQFKTARQKFKVIDDHTKTLIVPHGEGKEIIADICSAKGMYEKAKLLKRAQGFSVSVYSNKYDIINRNEGIISCNIEGVYILNEAFYNEETGITTEKKLPDMFD